ncbi:DUF4271 domain-containing protein [Gilvibacter sediminis]|uniref:DUF4271 domain-containing protein n=1 Tax=Gilvibacter sediminis TaxID=379071 RepID=UPI002350B8FD|nr:DUF4271 domain-containing protein [Gilvibacter sediminis]MDC7997208.1 DUF4271 domain-containing protein [Gilvibacter sediminis]
MEISQLNLREINSDTWIISLVVGCLVVMSVAAYNYRESFRSFLQLPYTNRYFILSGKHQNTANPFSILLFFVGLIGAGLFAALISAGTQPQKSLGIALFLQMTAGIFAFFSIKMILTRLIGIVFKLENLVQAYVFEKLNFLNLIGLGLLLASVLYYFGPLRNTWVLYVAAGLAGLGYLMGLIYSYKNNENLIFRNFFYFILYLCALEISPFILLFKALN